MGAQISGSVAPNIFHVITAVYPDIKMCNSSDTPSRKRRTAV